MALRVRCVNFAINNRSKKGVIQSPYGIKSYQCHLKIKTHDGGYRSPIKIIFDKLNRRIKESEKSETKDKPVINLLDACCGSGLFLNETFAEAIKHGVSSNIHLFGVDATYQKYQVIENWNNKTPQAIDVNKCESHHFNFIESDILSFNPSGPVSLADGGKYDFNGFNGFDMIFMNQAFQYLDGKLETLEHIYNMLSFDGEAYVHMIRKTCMVLVKGKAVPFEDSILPEIAKQTDAVTFWPSASSVTIGLRKSRFLPKISFNVKYDHKEKYKMPGADGHESSSYVVSVYK